MDDTEPGTASPRSRAELVAHLCALSGPELLDELAGLDRASLRALADACLPRDCRCPVRFECPDHPDDDCDCPTVAAPCPHVLESLQRDWPALPNEAMQLLLLFLHPRDYGEPPLAPEASPNTNPKAHVAIMAERHRKRQHIRHPLDWLVDRDRIDVLARRLTRARNGADLVGELLPLAGASE